MCLKIIGFKYIQLNNPADMKDAVLIFDIYQSPKDYGRR